MTIRFGTSGGRAAIADDFTVVGVRQVTEAISADFGTSEEFKKSVITFAHSAANRSLRKRKSTRGEGLTPQLDKLYARVGRLEAGRIGVRLTEELMKSLSGKLNQEPKEIGGRAIARTNRIDGVKFILMLARGC